MSQRCACCGRTLEWSTLELVERLDDDRLSAVVTRWPDGVSVEIRKCVCGKSIARKAKR